MNREEAARIIDTLRDGFSPVLSCEQYRALGIAIKALKAQEWIPVSERLPKEWEHVLVMTDTPYTFNKIRVDWNIDNYWVNYGHHVIAWMPLPPAYEGE